MRTYSEILSAMESEYERVSGARAAEASDIGIRLRLLAGEILNLENNLRWMELQADPKTATGEYLDRLCEDRGIVRNLELNAGGTLVFGRSTPLLYDLAIPAGTVCATEDNMWEYITTEDSRLEMGALTVRVPAKAVSGGSSFNCAAGKINVMVTAPEGIETVTNDAPFSGGRARESDEALRSRLLAVYGLMQSGVSKAAYVAEAMKLEGITSADAVSDGAGNITVYVSSGSGVPAQNIIDELQLKLDEMRPLGVTVKAEEAVIFPVNVGYMLEVKSGHSLEAAKQEVEKIITEMFDGLQVGSSVTTARQTAAVMSCPAIENCVVGGADFEAVPGTLPVLGTITMMEMIS